MIKWAIRWCCAETKRNRSIKLYSVDLRDPLLFLRCGNILLHFPPVTWQSVWPDDNASAIISQYLGCRRLYISAGKYYQIFLSLLWENRLTQKRIAVFFCRVYHHPRELAYVRLPKWKLYLRVRVKLMFYAKKLLM